MQIFEAIKERVSVPEAASLYGIHINRHGKACCPFHSEKTPSFSVQDQYWHCFGCGTGCDVITLVQKLFGFTLPLEAARKLDNDFRLGLFKDSLSPGEQRKARQAAAKYGQDKQLTKSFDNWCDNALNTVRWFMWHLRDIKERDAPRSMDEPLKDSFCNALYDLATAEYLYDILAFGDYEERICLFNHWRKRVQDIENHRQSRSFTQSA